MPWNPHKSYHPPHLFADNLPYFITARTFNRQRIWHTVTAKRAFVSELRAAIQKCDITLYAWAVLDEHYHLLIHVQKRNDLTTFMRRLHSTTAIMINKRDHKPGRKVWYNYWDYCPRDERDFYRVFNYIHIQPVKHGKLPVPRGISPGSSDSRYALSPERMPELHELLARYEFTSYRYYARKYGVDAMADVWLDYPIPRSWEGDAF